MSDKTGVEISTVCDSSVHVILSKEIYEKEAVLASLYLFENKCVMKMTPESETLFRVDFTAKDRANLSDEALRSIIDDFCNELIDQQVRNDLEKRFGSIRKLIVEHAFSPIKNLENRVKENA